ncbi:MAG: YHS domain-containing (seleno)protein [Reyranellaceae bacterium]
MNLSRRASIAIVSLVTLGVALPTRAAPPVYQRNGYAIDGYDPVTYFSSKPEKGQSAFQSTWRNSTWLFASAANKAAFDASPERYAPQYGGHCSMSMRGGKLSSGDPLAWRLESGKVYLNGSPRVRDNWLLQMAQNIKDADWHWQKTYANR